EAVALEHDHAVEPQVGDLAHQVQAVAALGREHGLGRLLADFLQHRVVALREQLRDVGFRRIAAFALVDGMRDAFQDGFHFLYMREGSLRTGSTVTHFPFSSLRKKQLSRPVWQAMPPACCTFSSTASASQSRRTSTTFCTLPDSSPLRQSFLRERDQ